MILMGGHGPNIYELDTDGREEVKDKARTMGHVRPRSVRAVAQRDHARVATTQPSATTRSGQPKAPSKRAASFRSFWRSSWAHGGRLGAPVNKTWPCVSEGASTSTTSIVSNNISRLLHLELF